MTVECPYCQKEAKCVDDMLTQSYVAEMYRCPECEGTITVEYRANTISRETMKKFLYESKEA